MPPSKPPVFVLGSPRSGTTLLYHMLLSAGDFAIYRAESNVFNNFASRFADLRSANARRRLLAEWLASHRDGQLPDIDWGRAEARIARECRNAGDFLRMVMEAIAAEQGVSRWADCTPEHLLHVPQIMQTIPNALIIHIVRDGRDVALSLARQAWIRPLPGDRASTSLVAALYWDWMVRTGRRFGERLGSSKYLEVSFEELVTNPEATLAQIGAFVDHPMDYDRILASGIGSVSQPNTSFRSSDGASEFSPTGRWRGLPEKELAQIEGTIGTTLLEFGYRPATSTSRAPGSTGFALRRLLYHTYFSGKLWAKVRTPLGGLLGGPPPRPE